MGILKFNSRFSGHDFSLCFCKALLEYRSINFPHLRWCGCWFILRGYCMWVATKGGWHLLLHFYPVSYITLCLEMMTCMNMTMLLDLWSGYVVLSHFVHILLFVEKFRWMTIKTLQFVEKILEEGTKSPRTIRLAALHVSGLWLAYPNTLKYYIKELKLLTLYGSGMLWDF